MLAVMMLKQKALMKEMELSQTMHHVDVVVHEATFIFVFVLFVSQLLLDSMTSHRSHSNAPVSSPDSQFVRTD